jgi:hypothetical protein
MEARDYYHGYGLELKRPNSSDFPALWTLTPAILSYLPGLRSRCIHMLPCFGSSPTVALKELWAITKRDHRVRRGCRPDLSVMSEQLKELANA